MKIMNKAAGGGWEERGMKRIPKTSKAFSFFVSVLVFIFDRCWIKFILSKISYIYHIQNISKALYASAKYSHKPVNSFHVS